MSSFYKRSVINDGSSKKNSIRTLAGEIKGDIKLIIMLFRETIGKEARKDGVETRRNVRRVVEIASRYRVTARKRQTWEFERGVGTAREEITTGSNKSAGARGETGFNVVRNFVSGGTLEATWRAASFPSVRLPASLREPTVRSQLLKTIRANGCALLILIDRDLLATSKLPPRM